MDHLLLVERTALVNRDVPRVEVPHTLAGGGQRVERVPAAGSLLAVVVDGHPQRFVVGLCHVLALARDEFVEDTPRERLAVSRLVAWQRIRREVSRVRVESRRIAKQPRDRTVRTDRVGQ